MASRADGFEAVRWIDVILVVAAIPFALAMGAPALGFLVGAAAWTLTRVIGHLVDRRARRSTDIRTAVGAPLFVGLGRAWLCGIAVLVVGLTAERHDGLTAALVCLAAFTTYLAVTVVTRPQPARRKVTTP